jgi:hypothetical protein
MQPVGFLPAFLFIMLARSVKSLRGLALRFVVAVFRPLDMDPLPSLLFMPVFSTHRKTEAARFSET